MLEKVNQSIDYREKKPALLKYSCVAGYIFVGLTILMGLLLIILSKAPNFFNVIPKIDFFYISVASGKVSLGFALMSIILPIIAFFGIVQLWYQLKIGFWIFSVSKILLISMPFLFIDLSLGDLWLIVQPLLIITIILIVLFGLNYKKMY